MEAQRRQAARQLRTSRTSLGLYGALLVLPTLVFGWLYWRELVKDYEGQLSTVPTSAQDGARRVRDGMKATLDKLVESEGRRPFYEYSTVISPEEALDELALQSSPLTTVERPPQGVLGWFCYERNRLDGGDDAIEVFLAGRSTKPDIARQELRAIVADFRERKNAEEWGQRLKQGLGMTEKELPLTAVAASRLSSVEALECLRRCTPLLRGKRMKASTSPLLLQFYLQTLPDGSTRPRAFASRLVLCSPIGEVPREAPCVAALARSFELFQGFVIDVGWLLHELPASTARQALSGAEELREAPQALPYDNVGKVFAEIFPIRELGFDTYAPQEQSYGRLEVSINTESIDERFENQSRRFLAVGLMLVLTLATGITLMYKSVTRELEQAHRMQNFVAAVTHELRTPISAIRLHGEMLLDGWAEAPGKRQEYYRRILRETARLSTLVERVLEKSRLKETRVEVREADLNAEVEASLEALERADGRADLRISLAPGLPRVWTTPDAVEGILSNLVENARKYAPMADGGEPILVSTRREDKAVVVEVADRGPGVPSSERDRIFEAFYRMGSEATRTAAGTGLGLHLVRLHAEACGARASVLSREGGGSVFQVAFRPVG